MFMREHQTSQPQEKPSKVDIAIVEALLGKKIADKYAGKDQIETGKVGDGKYVPSTEETLAVNEATIESNIEKKAEETKRLWMIWADEFEIDRDEVKEHAIFQKNGDVIWDGNCNWHDIDFTYFPPNFKKVTGCLDLNNLSSITHIHLPNHIGGYLNLVGIISIEYGTLPDFIGGDLCLHSIKSIESSKLPNVINGNLILNQNNFTKKEVVELQKKYNVKLY